MLTGMGRKVARRRLGRYDDHEDVFPEDDLDWDAENPQWKATAKKLSQRAPKCPRVYDKATDLQKKSRKGDAPACDDAVIGKAVLQAFAGPCKKAEKTYRKAIMTCKRIGR